MFYAPKKTRRLKAKNVSLKKEIYIQINGKKETR